MENYKSIIASNIKRIRNERELSLDKVATLTGVSKSMLSQIEKGNANPSISTLWKLSNGFKISFTELINAPEHTVELINIHDKEPLTEDNGKLRNYPISLFDSEKRFETYQIELDPKGTHNAEPHPPKTQEHITVMKGCIDVTVENKEYHLKDGDTLKFKADINHSYFNPGNKTCLMHMILYYPKN